MLAGRREFLLATVTRRKLSWRRYLEADANEMGYSQIQLERLAQDRNASRNHVGGLCPKRDDEGFD